MNKLFLLLLLIISFSTNFGMHRIFKRAVKADKAGDFFTNKFFIGGKETSVTSYFNLAPYKETIEQTLTYNSNNTYDIRKLELCLCREAQNSQSFYTTYRGLLGFLWGLSTIGVSYATAKFIIYKNISTDSESIQENNNEEQSHERKSLTLGHGNWPRAV